MTIVDRMTPVYYKVLRIGLMQEGGDIIAIGDFAIFNAAGKRIETDNPSIELTTAERQAVVAFVNRNKTTYETATGLEELP